MKEKLTLKVISPDGILVDTLADSVELPAYNGSLGVLRGHAPLIAALTGGKMRYTIDKEEKELDINGGVVQVKDDLVTVVTE